MRVGIYARVSTANNGQDPTMQTRELKEYAERRGWTVSGEYVDVGISGTKEKRPELDRLMVDAHRRRFDAVVVWKFDRFARSVSHLLRALETFKAQGIEFVSFSEQLDTSTPAGKLVFTVLGAVAELERSLIVERVRAGMRNARARGKQIGRPPLTLLSGDMRRSIYEVHKAGGATLRQLAARFSTSIGSVQRSIRAYQKASEEADLSGAFSSLNFLLSSRTKRFLLIVTRRRQRNWLGTARIKRGATESDIIPNQ
jgi:DNA invertase Pin-like site-specific DNA recombinase